MFNVFKNKNIGKIKKNVKNAFFIEK